MRENTSGGGVKEAVGEVLPCAAMVVVEGCVIGLTIMTSVAMARGMSPFVFVAYTNVLGSIILIPTSFFYHRADRSEGPLLSMAFLVRVFLLGLIGVTIAQNLAYVGLSYSSPIVACGMANQLPAFAFVLGIILRTTKLDWKSRGSRARLLGTFISFTGAISLALYKGPAIRNHSSPSLALQAGPPRLLVFTSPTRENWVLGCIFFAASSLTLAIWNIVQVGTAKICPHIMKVVSFYSFFGAIQSCLVAVFLERDPVAWKLDLSFELFIIVATAIFSTLIRTSVQIWCTRAKGPHFVPAFKPFGIPYASTFGCLLFSDTFHYGSMMGAFVCGVGYYTALWGQIKDEDGTQKSDDQKFPLLQEESQV